MVLMMIFGEKSEDKYNRKQQRLKNLYEKWIPWFAWYPVKLDDGRWCWLHWVVRKKFICYLDGHYWTAGSDWVKLNASKS